MEKSVLEKIQDPWVENHYNMTSTSKQYPAPKHGGHVSNINDPNLREFSAMPYKMYSAGGPLFGETLRQDMVGHMHKETPLNSVFFSDSNVDKLQKDIQQRVYDMSGGKYKIDRQNDDDLKIIMRSYYLMFGQNNPMKVAEELKDLNQRVLQYAANRIYSEVDFHMFYLKDLQDFAPPIANPMNTAVYGTRTGELKSFF